MDELGDVMIVTAAVALASLTDDPKALFDAKIQRIADRSGVTNGTADVP
ncbi:hypothetical protein ACFWGI_39770 [Streptomyces niveus]